jgi:hypothetical protein
MRTPRALHRHDPETQVRVAPRLDVEGVEMLPGVVLLRVTCMIRSATHFTRATWILPMSKEFVREKTDW